MSPSKTIHLGPSPVRLDWSLMMVLNRPSLHSLVAGFITPYRSSLLTAFGFKSVQIGLSFWFW